MFKSQGKIVNKSEFYSGFDYAYEIIPWMPHIGMNPIIVIYACGTGPFSQLQVRKIEKRVSASDSGTISCSRNRTIENSFPQPILVRSSIIRT
jgi:hypothetical protein